jgi:hypothetical protein
MALNLGLVIYGDLNIISGGYLYDRKLVEHLRRQGDRVEVIGLPWRGYLRGLSDNFSPSLQRRFPAPTALCGLQNRLLVPFTA